MKTIKHIIAVVVLATITLSGCGDSSGRYELSSSTGGRVYVLDTKNGTLWTIADTGDAVSMRELIHDAEDAEFIKVAKIPKD